MLDKVFTNNQVTIAGEVVSEFTFSHEVYGEHFYIVNIAVCRLSNSYDVIPVMVSERLIDVTSDYRGCVLQVSVLTTDMKKIEIVWCYPYLPGRQCLLRRKMRMSKIRIIFFWTDMCASIRCIVRHRWDVRLPMCC